MHKQIDYHNVVKSLDLERLGEGENERGARGSGGGRD